MHGEGWRRLWELLKSLTAIAVGVFCANEVAQTLPVPTADSSPTAGQVLTGLAIVAVIAGGLVFGFLSALEWVYRGFRPRYTGPASDQPQAVDGVPEPSPAQEQYPALPSPDCTQRPVSEGSQLSSPTRLS